MRLRSVLIMGIVLGALLLSGCSAPAQLDSGIRGMVTLGPTSPTQKPGAANTEPYAADLVIKPQGGRSSVARVKSGDDGRFSIDLEPGTYVIRAAESKPGSILKPISVTVEARRYTEVAVPFDSGIR